VKNLTAALAYWMCFFCKQDSTGNGACTNCGT
jgi:hypothetical protein